MNVDRRAGAWPTALLAVLIAVLTFSAGSAQATAPVEAEGNWLFRVRAIKIITPDHARTTPFHADSDISNAYMIDFSLSYFVKPFFSLEFTPGLSRYSSHARNTPFGDISLGHINVATPMLLGQFRPLQYFQVGPYHWASPYAGVGILFAHYFGEGSFGGAPLDYKDRFGPVLEIGGDFRIAPRWYANFEVKKVFLDTTLKGLNGALRSEIEINPWVVGFGIGYRF